MATSLGTKGAGGKNLVRDKQKFDQGYDSIRWKTKKKDVVRKQSTDKGLNK